MTPHLVKWHEQFQSDGLVIIEIDNGLADPLDRVQEWVRREKIPYAVLHDVDGSICQQYRVQGYPTTYLLDRSGKVVWEGAGWSDAVSKTLDAAIRRAVGS